MESDYIIEVLEVDQNPLPAANHQNIRSAVTEFEVWCNNGYDWLTQRDHSEKWKPVQECATAGI
jgi:hypothetical protein